MDKIEEAQQLFQQIVSHLATKKGQEEHARFIEDARADTLPLLRAVQEGETSVDRHIYVNSQKAHAPHELHEGQIFVRDRGIELLTTVWKTVVIPFN